VMITRFETLKHRRPLFVVEYMLISGICGAMNATTTDGESSR
jgi:hypothetical protein